MKKETRQKIIDNVIASSKHEGYVDDGFNRDVLKRKANTELTSKQAKNIMTKHALNK